MSFQRKLFKLCGSRIVTCQVWESVPRRLSVWPPTTWHKHGAVLHTTKAYLDQACSLHLALRPFTLVWNEASQLTEDTTCSEFSIELSMICKDLLSFWPFSFMSIKFNRFSNATSSWFSVQAGPFVLQIETYELLKTNGKSHNMPYSLPRTL